MWQSAVRTVEALEGALATVAEKYAAVAIPAIDKAHGLLKVGGTARSFSQRSR